MGTKESARHRALALVKDEHRSLTAVVHALQYLTKQLIQGKEPNQTLLGSIAHYILQFPEKLHHPAEDKFIFAPLRKKTQEAKDVLDALEAEHAAGDVRAAMMSEALNQLAAHTPGAVGDFAQAVDDYARFYWAHMMTEETIVLPLAERILDEADWVAAADGFAANHDPMYGPDTAHEFDALFKRIVYLTPAPVGLGGSE
jgi:hemerythrin-like domain-containing protein